MQTKVFEVRDRATHIGVIATKMVATDSRERYEVRRCGFSADHPLVLIVEMSGYKASYGAYNWRTAGNNTMFTAHQYIEEHFDELEPGAVIDTEYIRGESHTAKESEACKCY